MAAILKIQNGRHNSIRKNVNIGSHYMWALNFTKKQELASPHKTPTNPILMT